MSKLISVDLAIRQTGIAVFTDTHLDYTATIPETLGAIYKPLDMHQLEDGLEADRGLMSFLDKNATIIIEYNTHVRSPKLLQFVLEVKGYLIGKGYHPILINSNHWMALADKFFAIKRHSFPSGRDYNKLWIKKIADHIIPKYPFKSQDEIDATVMGMVYLSHPTAF